MKKQQELKMKLVKLHLKHSTQLRPAKERETLITSVKNDYLSPYELCDLYKQLYGSPLEVKNSIFKSTYIAYIDGVRVQLDSGDLKRKLLAKI